MACDMGPRADHRILRRTRTGEWGVVERDSRRFGLRDGCGTDRRSVGGRGWRARGLRPLLCSWKDHATAADLFGEHCRSVRMRRAGPARERERAPSGSVRAGMLERDGAPWKWSDPGKPRSVRSRTRGRPLRRLAMGMLVLRFATRRCILQRGLPVPEWPLRGDDRRRPGEGAGCDYMRNMLACPCSRSELRGSEQRRRMSGGHSVLETDLHAGTCLHAGRRGGCRRKLRFFRECHMQPRPLLRPANSAVRASRSLGCLLRRILPERVCGAPVVCGRFGRLYVPNGRDGGRLLQRR
jgi:hypothetical protein